MLLRTADPGEHFLLVGKASLFRQLRHQSGQSLRKLPVAPACQVHAVKTIEFCNALRIQESTALPFG